MAFHKLTYNTDKETARINTVGPIRSKEDIQAICDFFDSQGWHKYSVIFKFGISTGLRAGDILSFKVKDVYKREKVILREQKTGKIREFPLKQNLQDMLNEFCEGRDPEEYVFEGRQHKKLDRSQVYRRIVEAGQALGIKENIGTHTMRKTFGYLHFRQYRDITILQSIFNHATPDVTKRYIGITQDEMDSTILGLNTEPGTDELTQLKNKAVAGERIAAKRARSFIQSYIKNGGKKHLEFAYIVLEILCNPTRDTHVFTQNGFRQPDEE